MSKKREKISFSEMKTWKECPYKHKLVYIDELPHFSGNEYTAFGTSMHLVCEKIIMDSDLDSYSIFLSSFQEEIDQLSPDHIHDQALIEEMKLQAKNICEEILPEIYLFFGEFEVISVEESLYERIDEFDSVGRSFKGFVDLILKTPDGCHHIIDWKTCSWGWDSRKKSDAVTNYQLMYYKNYYSKKYSVDKDKIKTYFALLKRTAKKNRVEIVPVTSGVKKIKNSLNLLEKAVINIERDNFIKNRLSCKYCKFYKTEHCS